MLSLYECKKIKNEIVLKIEMKIALRINVSKLYVQV